MLFEERRNLESDEKTKDKLKLFLIKMNKWKFQEEAINNIVNEFKSNNKSRSLVIIPTGGGKTLTAIRAQIILLKGLIDNNKCLWVTHLRSLKDQTIAVRDNENNEDFINEFNFSDNLKNFLQIEMVIAAKELIRNDNNKAFKYVVLDECHHSSANSYQTFFVKTLRNTRFNCHS